MTDTRRHRTPFELIAHKLEREKTEELFNRLRVGVAGETGQVAGNALCALLAVAIGSDLPGRLEDETFLIILDKVQQALRLYRSGQWQPFNGMFEQLLTQAPDLKAKGEPHEHRG